MSNHIIRRFYHLSSYSFPVSTSLKSKRLKIYLSALQSRHLYLVLMQFGRQYCHRFSKLIHNYLSQRSQLQMFSLQCGIGINQCHIFLSCNDIPRSFRILCKCFHFTLDNLVLLMIHIKKSVKFNKPFGFCFQFFLLQERLLNLFFCIFKLRFCVFKKCHCRFEFIW